MTLALVDEIVAQFKGALLLVQLPEAATAMDVKYALKRIELDWTMPEKTHSIPAGPAPIDPTPPDPDGEIDARQRELEGGRSFR